MHIIASSYGACSCTVHTPAQNAAAFYLAKKHAQQKSAQKACQTCKFLVQVVLYKFLKCLSAVLWH